MFIKYPVTHLEQKHLKLLEALKNRYSKTGQICFVHLATTYIFGMLHFHITSFDEYTRNYPTDEKGTYILREINIDELINTIKLNGRYYNDFNIPILNIRI